MSRSLTFSCNAATVSPSKAIATAARLGPLMVITGRAFSDLVDELGSDDAAMRHLVRVSENVGKPIGVNFSTSSDTSRTVFMAPRAWTPERLAGWVAGHHELIEDAFDTAPPVPLEDL
jgi:hypothetical protein